MDNRIEVRGLSKAYGSRRLFTDVSVSIPDKSVFVLHGPNGSGKTTFLHILCGLVPATTGQIDVVIAGKVLTRNERRAQLGLVSTELSLYDDLSAVENLQFFSAVRGLHFNLARAREMLESVGLKGRGRDYLRTFSSGMKQRIKYACALWHNPHILVLDEPTSHMDEQGVALIGNIIHDQRTRGIVIMATNEPKELCYADQALRLAQ